MGYKPEKQHYKLSFEDRPGMEVVMKSVPLGKMNKISTLKIDHQEQDEKKRMTVFAELANYMVRWNLEHPEPDELDEAGNCAECGLAEDDPMPIGLLSLKCLDTAIVSAMLTGWMFAMARASLPKGMSSNSGGKSGPSIPLSDGITDEIMSKLEQLQNPMTLPTPNLSLD